MLKERLRQALIDQAQTGTPTTYKELADRLGLEPPQTIHRLGEALETLMKDDVAANRPMLAALCVSKVRSGIPGRGFFLAAKVLGYFHDRRARRPVPSTRTSCSVCFHSGGGQAPDRIRRRLGSSSGRRLRLQKPRLRPAWVRSAKIKNCGC